MNVDKKRADAWMRDACKRFEKEFRVKAPNRTVITVLACEVTPRGSADGVHMFCNTNNGDMLMQLKVATASATRGQEN